MSTIGPFLFQSNQNSSSSSSSRSTNIRHRGDCRCDICMKKYKFAPSTQQPAKKVVHADQEETSDSNSMPVATVSDDDLLKKKSPQPPAAHCRRTPTAASTVSVASVSEETKPLDLSIKPTEQPLNLCSKRKRSTPVSLSKRNHTSVPPASTLPTTTTTTAAAAVAAAASSMFIPFYTLSPFFDPNGGNQQELLQQFQTFYSQLQLQQQQQHKLPKTE